MANQNSAIRDMEKSFANIRLEEEEHSGLTYEGATENSLSEVDVRWCLVGKFLTDSPIDFQAMKHKMASLWKPGRGVYVKALESNRFVFQFYHEVDIRRVIEGSPCTFGRFPLVFERLKEGDDPRSIIINKLDLWVQLHNMSPGFMSLRVVQDVSNYIGSYVESDANNFIGVWHEYPRVRVTIPLNRPLKRRMKLKKSEESWCWVNFKYEVVPTFCFICGLMGHNEKFCDKIFDIPIENIEKPYGIWMKAEPRRRNNTIESKWLRQGNQFSGTNTVANMEAWTGNSDGTEVAKDKLNPLILARDKITVETSSVKGGIRMAGGDKTEITGYLSNSKDNLALNNVVVLGPNEILDHGLNIVDPKRRRIEDVAGRSPNPESRQGDTTLIEIQEDDSQNQKNELKVGAAMQARLEL